MGAQPHHADWTGVGFILEFEDRAEGEVAFIIKVPGGAVDAQSLRMAAAAPDLIAAAIKAMDECVDLLETPAGKALEAAIAKALGQGAEGVS